VSHGEMMLCQIKVSVISHIFIVLQDVWWHCILCLWPIMKPFVKLWRVFHSFTAKAGWYGVASGHENCFGLLESNGCANLSVANESKMQTQYILKFN